jgi:hypothetical protein
MICLLWLSKGVYERDLDLTVVTAERLDEIDLILGHFRDPDPPILARCYLHCLGSYKVLISTNHVART